MNNQAKHQVRKLQRTALLMGLLVWAVPVAAAQYFYAVDFHSPLNQVGQVPATGAGPETPSSIVAGSPTVVSSFGHLTDQPLLFTGIYYQQIGFDLLRGAPDYFVDFDFETRNLNPSLFSFRVIFDTPYAQSFGLHGFGYIAVPPANSPGLPGWTDGDLHHMHIGVDLTAGSWSFQLDDRAPVTGAFFPDSGDVLSVRMNLSAWRAFAPDDPNVQIALDNILIGTTIPEPPSSALMSFALGVLLLLPHPSRNRTERLSALEAMAG